MKLYIRRCCVVRGQTNSLVRLKTFDYNVMPRKYFQFERSSTAQMTFT